MLRGACVGLITYIKVYALGRPVVHTRKINYPVVGCWLMLMLMLDIFVSPVVCWIVDSQKTNIKLSLLSHSIQTETSGKRKDSHWVPFAAAALVNRTRCRIELQWRHFSAPSSDQHVSFRHVSCQPLWNGP